MSRQDKTISERHTRTLRELVRSPENKVCADCKRNDPRWASWNLGVFLCIRCSGIHRSMGTHISKVKSVDLDIWTPDQMHSVQQWGNARANLYWEAHLKPGHIPAEHKMESFIRSKYESRRWALDGLPPKDPSVLEPRPPNTQRQASPPPVSAPAQSTQRQSYALSSESGSNLPPSQAQRTITTAPPSSPPVASSQADLFSLDFHAPTPTSSAPGMANGQKRDVKNDILSLFATSPPPGSGVIGGAGTNLGVGVTPPQVQQAPSPPTSMMGTTGTAMWGVQSGWTGIQETQPTQGNIWGQPKPQAQQQQFSAFGGVAQPQDSRQIPAQNIWDGGGTTATSGGASGDLFSAPFSSPATQQTSRKDDAFGDLWGGFK